MGAASGIEIGLAAAIDRRHAYDAVVGGGEGGWGGGAFVTDRRNDNHAGFERLRDGALKRGVIGSGETKVHDADTGCDETVESEDQSGHICRPFTGLTAHDVQQDQAIGLGAVGIGKITQDDSCNSIAVASHGRLVHKALDLPGANRVGREPVDQADRCRLVSLVLHRRQRGRDILLLIYRNLAGGAVKVVVA